MEIKDTFLGRRAWDDALGPAALQHGWAYGAVAARHGATIRRVHLRDGAAEARAQIVCRSLGPIAVAYLPLGACWIDGRGDDARALAALRRWLARDRPSLLVAPSPERPQRFAPRLSGPRDVAVLDLAGCDPLRAMSKKWRNRLRAAERSGLGIRSVNGIPDWLIETERRQQRRRRYGNLPASWIAAWQRLAPGAALTLVAGPPHAPVAAMGFITHGAGATYLLGWSSEEGRRLSAHNLLMWRAMSLLRARGVGRLDLGLIDRAANPGLVRFKLGTGAVPVRVPPVYGLGPGIADWLRGDARGVLPDRIA